jgi:hypothetical protein
MDTRRGGPQGPIVGKIEFPTDRGDVNHGWRLG